MLKLRIALYLALVVGTLTLANGILYDARAVTIIYRVVISVVIFGLAGYCLGVGIEVFLKRLLLKDIEKRQHNDTIHEQQVSDELSTESEFSPFTSGNFEQISRPKE